MWGGIGGRAVEGEDEEASLKPFRLLEPRLRQLVSSVVPRSLAALQQHRQNITQLLEEGDWEKVNAEQINAARTAQQLKDHLRSLEELRAQIKRSEVKQFDSRVEGIREQLEQSLMGYGITVATTSVSQLQSPFGAHLSSDIHSSQYDVVPSTVADHNLLNTHTLESWEQLKTELNGLQEITAELSKGIQAQREQVQCVAEAVDEAAVVVKGGKSDIVKGSKYNIKSYVYPIGGAVLFGMVGALVGGPVGLVAGANVGAAIALTGVTAGSISGGLLGRKVYKSTLPQEEIELQEMKKTL